MLQAPIPFLQFSKKIRLLLLLIPLQIFGGSYAYKSGNDLLRITVPRTESETSLEAFSIAFSEKKEQPKIHMGWANVRFEIPFTVL